ncbi:hypothetical protein NPIL_364631 [Nephila pilipes]|uniref:Uncharacterized protein n=1 Tax=Nephila pilipes TaxID=299642 RepID=A0A8X6QSK0_NEPPI|nr:hypothetical protein NPIL_364631 [Nephila pilipes]
MTHHAKKKKLKMTVYQRSLVLINKSIINFTRRIRRRFMLDPDKDDESKFLKKKLLLMQLYCHKYKLALPKITTSNICKNARGPMGNSKRNITVDIL